MNDKSFNEEESKERSIELTVESRSFNITHSQSFRNYRKTMSLDNSIDEGPAYMSQSVTIPVASRATVFGYDIMKAVSVLTLNPKDKSFYLSQAARELLLNLTGECYVISVSGSPLVGKSSFLNLFISYFLNYISPANDGEGNIIAYQQIYTVGDGRRSTTEGIDMYSLKIGDKNILIMDIEGDNDPSRKETGVWIYTNLITMAVGVSNIHLYNYTGLPQQSFIDYFKSISKLVKSNKLHPNFETKFKYMKRNHNFYEEKDLEEDQIEIEAYFEKIMNDLYTKDSLFLFKAPPNHITVLKDPKSCIRIEGFICEDCQKEFFFKTFQKLFDNIITHIKTEPGYSSGTEIVEQIEKILDINKRDLKFIPDLGHVSKIRLQKFRKLQSRINQEILQVEPPLLDRNLSQQIQNLINDHPGLSDMDLLNSFNRSLNTVTMRIAQMEYLIPEISKYVEESLIDVAFTVLSQDEKDLLMSTYCKPFESVTADLLKALKEYEKMSDTLMEKLLYIKDEIHKNIKEYILAIEKARNNTTVAITQIASSATLGLVAREVGVQLFAGFLIGGGVIGAAFVVYAVVKAKKKLDESKKKNDELINSKKIDGINNVGEAEEAMKTVESFVANVFEELSEKNKTLKEVCSEERSRNYLLIEHIEKFLDKKLKGEEIKMEEIIKLIQAMKVSQNNLERYKQCI